MSDFRIFHTADWHLGQTFHGHDRAWEHQAFLEWLLATLAEYSPHALVVTGDLFDHANPGATAQNQLYGFLARAHLLLPHLAIVLIAGNHDSPSRLEAPQPLLARYGIRVIGQPARDDAQRPQPTIFPWTDLTGRPVAWCAALPFIRPGEFPTTQETPDSYTTGMTQLYQQAATRAKELRAPGQPLIALGHLHVSGGVVSELSERKLVVGNSAALPATMFDPAFDYVALGHLHRPQRIAHQERIRYSGSPLPLSFAEIAYPHQVVMSDFKNGELEAVTPLAVPRAVNLLRLPPDLPRSKAEVLALLAQLQLPELPLERQPYLEVRVKLTAPEPGLRTQVESALREKPVRLARIETSREGGFPEAAAPPLDLEAISRLDPTRLFDALYRERYGASPAPELRAALGELLLEEEAE